MPEFRSCFSTCLVSLFTAMLLALLGSSARAATFTWDGGGGANTWVTVENWNPDGAPPIASGANDFVFTDATLRASPQFEASYTINSLTFGSGGGAFSFTGANNAQNLTINAGGILNSSGSAQSFASTLETITLGASQTWDAGTASGGSMTFNVGTLALGASQTLTIDGVNNTTINSAVTGTGTSGLTKNGTGTLTLGGGSSTYAGATLINAGTVILGKITGLGGIGAGTTVSSGAVLDLNGQNVGAEALTLNGTGISDGGALINSSGTAAALSGAVTLETSSSVGGSGNLTLSGVISGSGGLTKIGAGTLTLSGANTYDGDTTINAGTLQVSQNNAIPSGTGNGNVQIGAAGTLGIGGNGIIINGLSGSGSVNHNVGGIDTFNLGNNNASGDFSGTIANSSGTLNLQKNGSGVQTFSGSSANTYSGSTTVNDGRLELNKTGVLAFSGTTLVIGNGTGAADSAEVRLLQASQMPATTTVSINTDGLLALNGNNQTIGTLAMTAGSVTTGSGILTLGGNVSITANAASATISGNLNLGAATRTFTIANGTAAEDMVISAVISGTGVGLNKAGTGALTLDGDNTFTGGLNVSAGTIVLGHDNAAGSGLLTLGGGTTIQGANGLRTIANQLSIGGNVTFSGTDLKFTASFNPGNQRTYTVNNTTEFSGAFTVSHDLIKSGTGTLILSGANAMGNVTVNAGGALQLANDNALGTPGLGEDTIVNSGGALQLFGGRTIGNETLTLDGTGVNNDGALRNLSGDSSWGGNITIDSTTRINSDAGTLTLDVISGNAINGTDDNLQFGGAGNITINDAIATGAGTLTKDGTGTLTLNAVNTYTGVTAIDQGAVNIRNNDALGTIAGGVTVGNGGALELQNNIAVGAEALTLNGSGIGAGGALRNVSGNNSYAGAVSLNTASRINSDAGTLTLSGGISGGQALTVGGAGTVTVNTTGISGAGTSLTKDGAGTLNLNVASTYAGGTTLGGSGAITLGVNDALGSGGFNFAGGILNANNTTDSSIGALSLTANSTLQLSPGGAAGSLTFSSATWTAGVLTIAGWSGDPGGLGTDDKIFITSTPDTSFLNNVYFDLGGGNIYFADMGTGNELIPGLTPVPEPVNVALGVFGVLVVGVSLGRRCLARFRREA